MKEAERTIKDARKVITQITKDIDEQHAHEQEEVSAQLQGHAPGIYEEGNTAVGGGNLAKRKIIDPRGKPSQAEKSRRRPRQDQLTLVERSNGWRDAHKLTSQPTW